VKIRNAYLATLFSLIAGLSLSGLLFAAPNVDLVERSIVRVVIGGHGTGWVVSPGIVATNWHVTDGNTVFDIYPAGTNQEFRGELIWQGNSNRDIGLIRVPGLTLTPFKLHTEDAGRGSDAYTVGFPGLGDDLTGRANLNVSVYGGTIALVTENTYGVRIVQHTNIVNAGNSGGPLLDDCGRVLGLTTWGVENEQYSADFIWASVHVSELANQMDTLGIPYETDNSPCATGGVSATGEEGLEQTIRNWGIGFAVALALTMALALRRPRQQLVRVYDEVSRRIGGASPNRKQDSSQSRSSHGGGASVAGQAAVKQLVMSGMGDGKNSFRFEFGLESLQQSGKGLSIGRSRELSDFVLDDRAISRRHLRVSYRDNEIMVEDMNSSNGSQLNGKLLPAFKPQKLNVGDRIQIGNTEIAVSA
jgi:hypothetical protein